MKESKMKHSLEITLSKEIKPDATVGIKRVPIRERLLRFLLGDLKKVTLIVPGQDIRSIAIGEGGDELNEDCSSTE